MVYAVAVPKNLCELKQTSPYQSFSNFGSTAATITNRSQIIDSDTTSTVGLQVKPGKSISLLGGNIEFDSGRLTASGGRVNLGAVAPDSFVSLSSGDFGWILGYEGVNNFGDITLVGNHSFDNKNIHINTSGDRGGDIDIQGREILLFGAAIEAITLGSEDGGKLTINSSESLKFDGIPAEFTPTGIVSKEVIRQLSRIYKTDLDTDPQLKKLVADIEKANKVKD